MPPIYKKLDRDIKTIFITKYYLLVTGNVTDVGFRVFAKKIANNLDIKGYIENLKNNVQIFCDVKDNRVIEKFITELQSYNTKNQEKDIFGINVKDIKPYKEGEKGYDHPKYKIENLDQFYLDHELPDYADGEITKFEKEMLSRMEAGTGILQFKFNYIDNKYDKISDSLTSLVGIFKIYSIFMGGILLIVIIILVVLISKILV